MVGSVDGLVPLERVGAPRMTARSGAISLACLAWMTTGCTVANPNATDSTDDSTGGAASATAGADGTNDTTNATDDGGDGTGSDGVDAMPPTIGAVEVDDTAAPPTLTECATLTLSVAATDADGVDTVEFFDGQQPLGLAVEGPPGVWSLDWTLIGDRFDGDHELTAVATDTTSASTTSDVTTLTVDMPMHGEVAWSLTAPNADRFNAVAASTASDTILAVGADMNTALMAAHAAGSGDGKTWATTTFTTSAGDDSVALEVAYDAANDRFAVGGSVTDSNGEQDAFIAWFSANGVETATWSSGGISFSAGSDDGVAGMAFDDQGRLFAAVDSGQDDGRLFRFDVQGNQDSTGYVPSRPSDLAVANGTVYVVGNVLNVGARVDTLDLDLVNESNSQAIFGSSAIAFDGRTGNIIVAGKGSSSSRGKVSAYDASFTEVWSREFGPNEPSSSPTDLVVDPLGTVTVTGNVDGGVFATCTFADDGVPRWCIDTRSGPTTAYFWNQLALDRVGNIYLAGFESVPGGGLVRRLARIHP